MKNIDSKQRTNVEDIDSKQHINIKNIASKQDNNVEAIDSKQPQVEVKLAASDRNCLQGSASVFLLGDYLPYTLHCLLHCAVMYSALYCTV